MNKMPRHNSMCKVSLEVMVCHFESSRWKPNPSVCHMTQLINRRALGTELYFTGASLSLSSPV